MGFQALEKIRQFFGQGGFKPLRTRLCAPAPARFAHSPAHPPLRPRTSAHLPNTPAPRPPPLRLPRMGFQVLEKIRQFFGQGGFKPLRTRCTPRTSS